jgi:hypothetical protein
MHGGAVVPHDEIARPPAVAIKAPLGDFFACGWGRYAQVTSLAVCVNPGRAFNCYWEMPFRRGARLTLENRDPESEAVIYWQINYALTDVPEDAAYFHAQFRRTNPLPFKQDYIVLDDARGRGHYVGTYVAWGVNNSGWWGEGEIKFFLDGDEWPTMCGAGTEDYFCGAYNFDAGAVDPAFPRAYTEFTTPYSGLPQIIRPDGTYQSQQRFGLYRWHIMDPIRFETDLTVTLQAIGWRTEKDKRRYLPLQDDIAIRRCRRRRFRRSRTARLPRNRLAAMTTLPQGYSERAYAAVLGKLIGVYLGRPFEGWTYQRIMNELGPIEDYVHEWLNCPLVVTDDDVAN